MTNLLFFKHVDQFYEEMESDEIESDEMESDDVTEHLTTGLFSPSFSYDESINEFNRYRYHGASYSCFHLARHLINLICGCGRVKWKNP